jgi:pimeloyl-ACP methyl ester carboxylesterase
MGKKAALAALLFAAVLSATALAQTNPAPPFPAPGRLVDVGGWQLHLNCTGQDGGSQPTVILEAGIGDFSVEWSLVQPGVAKSARVCSYDRAGDGWSDLGPYPRTMHQLVYELHVLLVKAGVRPPFVVVGHSYGGWLVRLYAYTYPSEVAGMVLIDAGAGNPWRLQANGKLIRASDLATGKPIPAVLTSNPLKESDVPSAALNQMKAAAQNQGPTANEPPRNKLPADAQRMRTWSLSRWQHFVAGANPAESDELVVLATREKTEHPLGDLPLAVMTRGLPDESGPDARSLEEEHKQDQAAMALLSRNSKQVIATHSGHHIQLDEPELVIQTIRGVVTSVSK